MAASKLTQEQIVAGFQQLRNDQRALAAKHAELEQEQNEHRLVIETLDEIDGDRRCFRMVGGVLVERTVKDVLPALQNNKEQLSKVTENLKSQVELKGKEINEYREKYNIQIKGEQNSEEKKVQPEKSTQGVLVANEGQ